MSIILVNGFSAKTGGGRTILEDYLHNLAQSQDANNTFLILPPPDSDLSRFERDHIRVVTVPGSIKRTLFLPLFYWVYAPYLLRRERVDCILNFADIIIPTDVPQLYFFDWAYLVYPASPVWSRMTLRDYCVRSLKYKLIGALLPRVTTVIAQTVTMERRLKEVHSLDSVITIKSPVSQAVLNSSVRFCGELPQGRILLLCLAGYATHKNLEILLDVARGFRAATLPFTVVTTIDTLTSKRGKMLVDSIKRDRLNDEFINIGPVPLAEVADLYRRCDALLLPTLLESYGLPYVEAFSSGRTVITSDLDFARDLCGDAAFFFNPHDSESIISTIIFAFGNPELRMDKIALGKSLVREQQDSLNAFTKIQAAITDLVAASVQ